MTWRSRCDDTPTQRPARQFYHHAATLTDTFWRWSTRLTAAALVGILISLAALVLAHDGHRTLAVIVALAAACLAISATVLWAAWPRGGHRG